MKSIKLYYVILLMSFFVLFSFNAQSIKLSPLLTSLQLVGGDNTARNIKIVNSGSSDVSITCETEVLPESEGINVSYSHDFPYTISKQSSINVVMYIDTSLHLSAGNYTIITSFFGDTDDTHHSSKKNNVNYYVDDDDEPDEPDEPNNTTQPSDTNQTQHPPDDNDTNDTINNHQHQIPFFVPVILSVIISSCIMVLFFIRKRRREKI